MAGLPSSPAPDDHSQEARAAIARLLKAACSRLKRVERKLGKLRDDLAACEEAADLRQQGELLKAHLGRLTRGMDRAEVPDYYHPGQTRSIPLDPARPPKETVSRLFKKAAKLERGAERIPAEINRTEEERDALQAFADAAPEALALPEGTALPLAELEEQARRCNLQTKHSAPSEKRQQRPGKAEALRKSIRVFTSRDGVELLVGKSNTDNDTLTFRIARGNDWWFHLAPAAGSHVVARW
jgi:predicted ribosome quality control (RQC) complex YloA/Tae2 family protein